MVKHISAAATLPLRSAVLRNNQPLTACIFDTDNTGFHLGAYTDDQIVSIATFFAEDYPGKGSGGYRLRGMATDPQYAGKGFGSEIIKFALKELETDAAAYLWCNARSSALGFYKKLGFSIISEEFEVPGIGQHFNMLIQIKNI